MNGYRPYNWSDAELRRLIELWMDGDSAAVTAHKICREFGTGRTRNAVIGVANRLGLYRDKKRNGKSAYAKRRGNPEGRNGKIRAPKFKPAAEPPREIPKAPESKPCNIMELDSSRCKWIDGEPGEPFERIYCGGQTEPGKSYCAYHARASVSRRSGPRTDAEKAADAKRREKFLRIHQRVGRLEFQRRYGASP